MDDEEYKRLQAKFTGGAPTAAAPVGYMSDEAYEAAKAKFGAPAPQAAAAAAVAEPEQAPVQATLTENVRHAVGGLPQAAADTADLGYYLAEGLDVAGDYVPDAVKRGFRAVSPVTSDAVNTFIARNKNAGQPSEYPGLKQTKEALAPEFEGVHPAADYTRTALEWGAGGVPKLVGKLTQEGAKRLPQALSAIAPDAIAGGGAATGQAVGEYISPTEGGGAAGELIGGLVGVLAGLKTGKLEGLSESQRDMLVKLQDRFTNKEEAIAAVENAVQTGEIGTLFDVTGDRNIANVEAALERTGMGSRVLPEVQQARTAQIVDETGRTLQGDIPQGTTPELSSTQAGRVVDADTQDINEASQARLSAATRQAEQESSVLTNERAEAWQAADQRKAAADTAQEQAATARADLTPEGRPDQYSDAAAGKYNTEANRVKAEEVKPLWKAFDDGPDVNAPALKEAATDWWRTLTADERTRFNEVYQSDLAEINKWNRPMTPNAVSLHLQEMKETISTAVENGKNGWREKKLGELVAHLEETLAIPANSPEYAKAVAASKSWYDRFTPGYVGDVRKAAEPEEMLSQMGLTGDRGAATARLMTKGTGKPGDATPAVPGLMDDVANYLRAQAVRKDTLTEGFLTEYEAVLDAMPPNVRDEIVGLLAKEDASTTALTAAREAEDAAQRTSKNADSKQDSLTSALAAEQQRIETETKGLVDSTRTGSTAQYAKGGDQADAVIDDILTKPDGLERLEKLEADLLKGDMAQGGQAVMDSFRTRVNDRVKNRLFDLFDTAEGAPKPTALKDFRNMRKRLVDSGMVDAADAKYVDDLLSRAQTEATRRRASASVGNVISADTEYTNLLSSALSAIMLAPLPGGYNLQLGGAVRRYLKNSLEVKPTRKNIEAVVEYTSDPAAFLAGIEKLKTPEAQAKFFLTKLVGATQAAEILGGE